MSITQVTLHNFRCFTQERFDFTYPVTIIQGDNGSGKTSLIEALHYGCHLRSFRTHIPQDLARDLQNESDNTKGAGGAFSVKIATKLEDILIGVAGKQRSIKINDTKIKQYHELIQVYRVVTFVEDDLLWVKGYPDIRRHFLDQAIMIQDQEYYTLLRGLRKIVDQRNKVLTQFHQEQYALWTEQLQAVSETIVARRQAFLKQLNDALSLVTQAYGADITITLEYLPKATQDVQAELRARRTLYGPHLDDIRFNLGIVDGTQRDTRSFASRGQQKLTVMLVKIAQAQLLGSLRGNQGTVVFLIDDFLTDFDETRVRKLMALLRTLGNIQLVITVPQPHALLYSLCPEAGYITL